MVATMIDGFVQMLPTIDIYQY